MEDLRKDYKRGLVVAISFCVFVMPLLVPRMEETNNNNQTTVEKVGQKNFNDELKNAVKRHHESEEQDSSLHQPDSGKIENGDEVDGPMCLNSQLNSSEHLPEIVKDRLIDGIKELLEEKSSF